MQYTGDRVAFSLFGIDVYWYAIIIVTGMVLALYLVSREMGRRGMDPDNAYDIGLWILPFGVVGARLWYVIFEWHRYDSFLDVINIRDGGLAIQGGIIAGLIVGLVLARKKGFWFPRLSDIIMPGLALAQGIGRWGNFINNEAHGVPTDLPWGVIIDGVSYHPTFLYESLGDILLFFLLVLYTRKWLRRDGQVTCLYFVGYGILRYFVEGLRTDSLMVGDFRVAQILAILGIVVGLVWFIILSKKPDNASIPGKNPYHKKENESFSSL